MKNIFNLSFLLLALFTLSHGLRLVRKHSPAVLQAPIHRHIRSKDSLKLVELDNVRRAGTTDVSISNRITTYIMNVNLGTPSQTIGLHIDTGSSDLWVNLPTSKLCEHYTRYCNELGTFDPSSSSTYAVKNSLFEVSYEDGSGAKGDYSTDTITVGNATLPKFQFGVAKQSSTPTGIAGVGYRTDEGIARFGTQDLYPNLPASLASHGIINTNAFSLWLDDLQASTGSILFGGVNTAKFEGTLHTLPIVKTDGIYTQFLITLTSVGTGSDSSAFLGNVQTPALLDSGTTLTYLPDAAVKKIYQKFGASYNSKASIAEIPCSVGSQSGSVDFTFSGVTIRVPLSEIVISAGGGDICAFGIAPSSSFVVLGDTFLRSAYVVYDLSNNEISLAQTRYGNSADDILEITAGAHGVPSAAAVANAPTDVSYSGTARAPLSTGGVSGGSGSSSATPSAVPAAIWMFACLAAGAAIGGIIL